MNVAALLEITRELIDSSPNYADDFFRWLYVEHSMPLAKSTSKAAFSKNVKAEIAAGKPPKQAVAIAYSVKRQAQKKSKR